VVAETAIQLVRLLSNGDAQVRQVAFELARQAIETHVKDLVVEVELASESPPALTLHTALLALAASAPSRFDDVEVRACSTSVTTQG
jgi:hypothetical protein